MWILKGIKKYLYIGVLFFLLNSSWNLKIKH
jgi:hypothetical protein